MANRALQGRGGTVPSAPGQKKKEGVVQPSGTLKQGGYEWVLQGDQVARSGSRRVTVRSTSADVPPIPVRNRHRLRAARPSPPARRSSEQPT
jgi:hypothetical protein